MTVENNKKNVSLVSIKKTKMIFLIQTKFWNKQSTCLRNKYINFNQWQICLEQQNCYLPFFSKSNFDFGILSRHKLTSCLFSSYSTQWQWPWNNSFCKIGAKQSVFRMKFFRCAAEVETRGLHFQLVLSDRKGQVFTCWFCDLSKSFVKMARLFSNSEYIDIV
jgi:hypothetical protein